MGMDVWGKAATAKVGEYFCNNVWHWHPLWTYCEYVILELAGKVKHGHTNDGDGLGAEDSVALATRLREEIKSGRTAEFEAEYKKQNDDCPNEPCDLCGATGVRPNGRKRFGEQWFNNTGGCNKCHGKGWVRPTSTWYDFSVENVEKFASFLEECGGFEIN